MQCRKRLQFWRVQIRQSFLKHGHNHQTNKLLSFERYFWELLLFYCFNKPTSTQANPSYLRVLDPAVGTCRKNILVYKPTEKSYLKLNKPTALLHFTVSGFPNSLKILFGEIHHMKI